ncbi:MAG: hypothetical protein Q9181_002818 [Wetmoreana brouardii]
MSKRNITDFFKPFAFPPHAKRPLSNDGSEEPRSSQRSRSVTTKAESHPNIEHSDASGRSKDVLSISSQSSTLSSLQNSTPTPPFEQLPPGHESSTCTFEDHTPALLKDVETADSHGAFVTGSQRIVRNGEVIIKDSDDERSDSDLSLENLDDLIAPRKPPVKSPTIPEPKLPSYPSPAATRSKANSHKKKHKGVPASAIAADRPSTAAEMPRYKFSLDALVKQSKNDQVSRVSIENNRQLLESLEERKPASASTKTARLDKDLLAKVISKHEDGGVDLGRLLVAMERTEALHQEKTWSFIDQKQQAHNIQPGDCPSVSDPYWQAIVGDPITRQQAFLSGYIGECSSFWRLPDELLIWILNAGQFKVTKTGMRYSLDVGDQTTNCLTIRSFNAIFKRIGVSPESLDIDEVAIPSVTTHDVEDSGLQLQLLRYLPSFSSRQALFRRRLALAFFFCDESSLSEEREHLIDLKAVRRRLSHSRFSVNNETDYPGLAVSVAILAIGFDNGDPPPTHACKDTQAAFNESIDGLAQNIKRIDNQIIDTSASHRKRTEAKEVVDSFHKCLICTVRTEQKPRGMIWGAYAETEKQRSIMKRFFQKDMSAGDLDEVV